MKLIIMRHGEAGSHQIDAQRELTAGGIAESRAVAAQICAEQWCPAAIWSSNLVRARQTADLVAAQAGLEVSEYPFLTPESDPGYLIEVLQQHQGTGPLLLVSHMPLVGELVATLTEGRGTIFLTTSQAVCLDMEIAGAGCADLRQQFLP